MPYRERLRSTLAPVITLGIVLLLALVGCSSGIRPAVSVIGSTPTPKPRPATPVVTAASTTGWTVYRDPRFPFEVPVPPGWRASAFLDSDQGGVSGDCSYTTYIFPPGNNETAHRYVEVGLPEYMYLDMKINCPWFNPSANHWLVAEPSSISFGGQPSTLYDNDGEGQVHRITLAEYGGHQWEFTYLSTTSENYAHLALYLAMVQGFRYLG